ncbi:MAG: hypothetical protein RL266_2657 [Bacteroidota bacterium]
MKRTFLSQITLSGLLLMSLQPLAQDNPIITEWLQNTTIMGRHYVQGNPTPIQDNVLANCQSVQYSDQWVYVSTNGIPAYVTGPFLDGNPSLAQDQNAIFKFPLVPTENTGVPTPTSMGNIGVFINGVALFDYRDGVSWNNNAQQEGGGPLVGPPGQGIWNRDAIPAEREGFDCSKGHPAMGNYHHHQNPSAFDLDLVELSDICNLYDADGLYVIDPTEHSPLVGFAYDGFPIYGAYGFLNTDGTGPIVRIQSGYQLRDITVRTHYADGSDVIDGPAVSNNYPLGHYREDYEFVEHPGEPQYLDGHNGRWCVTPEYPNGTYAYFCTVDENHNSAFPYCVGPTYYGNKVAAKVNSINEPVTTYADDTNAILDKENFNFQLAVFPNPTVETLAVQIKGLNSTQKLVELFNSAGQLVLSTAIAAGSSISYLDVRSLYAGTYTLVISGAGTKETRQIIVN